VTDSEEDLTPTLVRRRRPRQSEESILSPPRPSGLPHPGENEPTNGDHNGHGVSVDPAQALVPREAAQEALDEAISAGRSFARPFEEFPAWARILKLVQEEFVNRSKVEGGPEVVKAENRYFDLVNDLVINQHPEFGIPPIQLGRLVQLLRTYQFGYRALEDYMLMDGLEELYFNRYDRGFYIIRGKKHRITDRVFQNEQELVDFVQHVARENGLEINLQSPNLDATLADGSRLNATLPPLAYDGPDFVIRKHRDIPFTIEQYIQTGMLTAELAQDLQRWIRAGMNMVVSGGTGSGKTSFLNTIGNTFIPRDDRLLILENRKELQIQTDDTKFFQTREDATREGRDENEVTMKDLIRYCLRKRPDRIIVGEVRGVETYYTLVAWNSGHDGSFCTVHANSAAAAVTKLEQLARSAGELDQDAIRGLISDAVDIIVQVMRYKGRGERKVTEVVQILHPYKYDHDDPATMRLVDELITSGKIRQERGDVMILPLYRLDNYGQLQRVNEAIPIEGKHTA
jgi:Flp pilus assembly CpaF family ATPase